MAATSCVSDKTPLINEKEDEEVIPKWRLILKSWLMQWRQGNGPKLSILIVCLVCFGAANAILFKQASNHYGSSYAFFLDQGNNVLYLLFSLSVVLYKFHFTKDITEKMRHFPERKFIVMASADACGTFLAFLGSVGTRGHFQTLLNQTLIPFTMLMAFIVLRTRYKFGEVLSALLVLGGAAVAILPSLIQPNDSDNANKWWAILLYVCSNIPMAFSAVYKELGFSSAYMDCYYLTCKVAAYQVLISFLLAPMQSVPGFGSPNGVPAKQIWVDLWDGLTCTFGHASQFQTVDCNTAAFWLIGYSVVNFSYNVLGLLLMREGSQSGLGAVLCTLAYALVLPVSNLLFTSSAIMGASAEPFSAYSASGLVIVLVGFCSYMWCSSLTSTAPDSTIPKRRRALSEGNDVESLGVPTLMFNDRVVGVISTGLTNPVDVPSRTTIGSGLYASI